jgi:hypothetical protein
MKLYFKCLGSNSLGKPEWCFVSALDEAYKFTTESEAKDELTTIRHQLPANLDIGQEVSSLKVEAVAEGYVITGEGKPTQRITTKE